jgi:hypothetical protein
MLVMKVENSFCCVYGHAEVSKLKDTAILTNEQNKVLFKV